MKPHNVVNTPFSIHKLSFYIMGPAYPYSFYYEVLGCNIKWKSNIITYRCPWWFVFGTQFHLLLLQGSICDKCPKEPMWWGVSHKGLWMLREEMRPVMYQSEMQQQKPIVFLWCVFAFICVSIHLCVFVSCLGSFSVWLLVYVGFPAVLLCLHSWGGTESGIGGILGLHPK